jgi:hypothetical protein
MRRLLQRIEDGRYYEGPGEWTDNRLEAHTFGETPSAIDCCVKEHLPPVMLVLNFGDDAYDLHLPLWLPPGLSSSTKTNRASGQAA